MNKKINFMMVAISIFFMSHISGMADNKAANPFYTYPELMKPALYQVIIKTDASDLPDPLKELVPRDKQDELDDFWNRFHSYIDPYLEQRGDDQENMSPYYYFKKYFPGSPQSRGEKFRGGDSKQKEINTIFATAVLINEKGYLLTSLKPLKNAKKIKLKDTSGKIYEIEKIFQKDYLPVEDKGVAILKIKPDKKKLQPIKMSGRIDIHPGAHVYSLGLFSSDVTNTPEPLMTEGRVSRVTEDRIIADLSIPAGSMGGVILGNDGELLGFLLGSGEGNLRGLTVGLPASENSIDVQTLLKEGEQPHGELGVYLQPLTDELKKKFGLGKRDGILVSDVIPGKPAALAGIKRGDILLEYNKTPVYSVRQVQRLVRATRAGKSIPVLILSDKKEKLFNVKISKNVTLNKEAKDIGFTLQALTDDLRKKFNIRASHGLMVSGIDGPAAEAGIRRGDVIVEIEHKSVNTIEEYNKVIKEVINNDSILVAYERDGTSVYTIIKPNPDTGK